MDKFPVQVGSHIKISKYLTFNMILWNKANTPCEMVSITIIIIIIIFDNSWYIWLSIFLLPKTLWVLVTEYYILQYDTVLHLLATKYLYNFGTKW